MTMNSKVHKAKLISIHNRLADRTSQNFAVSEDEGKSIHTYFALLKHIFQRNKLTIKKVKKTTFEQRESTFRQRSSRSRFESLRVSHLDTIGKKNSWNTHDRINKFDPDKITESSRSIGNNAEILLQNGKQVQISNSLVLEEDGNREFIPIGKITPKIQIKSQSQNPLRSKMGTNIEVVIYPKYLSERIKIQNKCYRTHSAQMSHITTKQKRTINAQPKGRYEKIHHLRRSQNKSQVFLQGSANLDPSPWQQV